MWQKNIQYSHTDVTEEGPEVDSSRRQIKDDRVVKTTRRRSRRWQIEDVQECTKDEAYKKKIQKMEKTNRRCSRRYWIWILQKMFQMISMMKMLYKCSKTSYDI